MIRIFAKAAIAAFIVSTVACSQPDPSEKGPSESVSASGSVEPAEASAAAASLKQTAPVITAKENVPNEKQSGCREEPAGNRGTERMTAMGTFGGITLYGSKGQLFCSEPGPGGVGECELPANAVAIAKGKTSSRALISSSRGTVIWYGGNGVSCAKRLAE